MRFNVIQAVLHGGAFAAVFHDATTDGDGGAGGGAGAGAGAGGDGAAGTGADGKPAVVDAGAGGGAGAGAGAGAGKKFEFSEDRTHWVDPKKLSAAERATQKAVNDANTYRQQLDAAQKRIQALAGVTPTDPVEQERQGIVDAFLKIFPSARFLTDDKLSAKFQEWLETGDQARDAVTHHWVTHREQVYGDLQTSFMDEINVDQLTPRQVTTLVAAFKASVPDDKADPEGYEQWRQRYERRDPTLITDFIKAYVEDMIEPARRQAVAGAVNRNPRVPQGGPRRPVAAPNKPKINFGDLDAVMAAAAADPRMAGNTR